MTLQKYLPENLGCLKFFLIFLFSAANTTFPQISIEGTVRSSLDKSSVDNALVLLFKIDSTDVVVKTKLLDSMRTGPSGNFTFKVTTDVQNRTSLLPKKFALSGCYPNPFSETTRMDLYLQDYSHCEIAVYNILGQFLQANRKLWAPAIIPFVGVEAHYRVIILPEYRSVMRYRS